MVDMIGTMMFIRSDQKLSVAYEAITNPALVAPLLTKPIDLIESGVVAPDRMFNVLYHELTAEPVETIANIYAFFDEPFTDEARNAIQDYVSNHPRTKRPAHSYATGQDEQVTKERSAFQRYQDYFHIPHEF